MSINLKHFLAEISSTYIFVLLQCNIIIFKKI